MLPLKNTYYVELHKDSFMNLFVYISEDPYFRMELLEMWLPLTQV